MDAMRTGAAAVLLVVATAAMPQAPPAPLPEPVAPVPVRPTARPPAEPSYPVPPTVARPRGITTAAVIAVPVPRVPVLPAQPVARAGGGLSLEPMGAPYVVHEDGTVERVPKHPWMGAPRDWLREPSQPAPPKLRGPYSHELRGYQAPAAPHASPREPHPPARPPAPWPPAWVPARPGYPVMLAAVPLSVPSYPAPLPYLAAVIEPAPES